MWEMIKLELRKALPPLLPVAAALLAVTLLRRGALTPHDPWLALAGAAVGAVVAYRLFTDSPGTRAFLFSRPFTRCRLFLVRWALGLALAAAPVLIAAACLAGGLREAVQIRIYRSPWYPMVRWPELNGLWPLGLNALLAYGAMMLMTAHGDLQAGGGQGGGRFGRAVHVWAALAIFCLASMMITTRMGPMATPFAAGLPLSVLYALLTTAASALAGLHAYLRLPVES